MLIYDGRRYYRYSLKSIEKDDDKPIKRRKLTQKEIESIKRTIVFLGKTSEEDIYC